MIPNEKPKVAFIGCGFVGGTWVDYLQEEKGYVRGRDLLCYDTDPQKQMQDDINQAGIVIICVPTPVTDEGHCDLSRLHQAIRKIHSQKHCWVVIRSTIPPGTTMRLARTYPHKSFIFIPEFLTEAHARDNFRYPDRIIISVVVNDDRRIADTLLGLLPRALALQAPSYPDDAYNRFDVTPTEAELAKYFGNVMGATKVGLANIFYDACVIEQFCLAQENIRTRVDYGVVMRIVAADMRIGPAHLQVGHGGYRGFGGYCFIKDTYAFRSFLAERWNYLMLKKRRVGGGELTSLLDLVRADIDVLDAQLRKNKILLELQGLTEAEAMKHSAELSELITSRKLKDIPDYLALIGEAKEGEWR